MKKIFKLRVALLAAALAFLSGCSRESALQNNISVEPVPVNISALAAVGDDVTVDGETIHLSSVRIIAIGRTSGRVDFNRRRTEADPEGGFLGFEEEDLGDNVTGNFIARMVPGTYDFYVIVNESEEHTEALNAMIRRADLEAIKITEADLEAMKADMESVICVGEVLDVQVRDADNDSDTDPNPGQISVAGATWADKLHVEVHRVVSKLTVRVRKYSEESPNADYFTITGAELSNIPEYSYVVADDYDGSLNNETLPVGANYFNENRQEYTIVVDEYIMPEYLTGSPDNKNVLTLSANYTEEGIGVEKNVEYIMPLLGDAPETGKYDLLRNKHYVISITIAACGEFNYTPTIEYEVGAWDEVAPGGGSVNIDDVITTTSNWRDGTTIEQGNVVVTRVPGVTIDFTLSHPEGALWQAYLTNEQDFEFVVNESYDNAGIAREASYSIHIRPIGDNTSGDLTTGFYILVRTESGAEREVDLTGVVGERYVIKQRQQN